MFETTEQKILALIAAFFVVMAVLAISIQAVKLEDTYDYLCSKYAECTPTPEPNPLSDIEWHW